MWLLGGLFPVTKESSLYSYIILVFNILLGIIAVPVNLLLAYGPENMHLLFLYLGLGMVALFYIMRTLRGLSISIFLIGQGIVPFYISLHRRNCACIGYDQGNFQHTGLKLITQIT